MRLSLSSPPPAPLHKWRGGRISFWLSHRSVLLLSDVAHLRVVAHLASHSWENGFPFARNDNFEIFWTYETTSMNDEGESRPFGRLINNIIL